MRANELDMMIDDKIRNISNLLRRDKEESFHLIFNTLNIQQQ